jgi:hypothetical protein
MTIQAFARDVPSRYRTRRQVRYAEDINYRNKAKDASRRSYRKKKNLELESCLYSLQFLDKAAKLTTVILPSGKQDKLPVLSIPKTADMLQLLYQTLWRWIDNGIVPAPILNVPLPKRPYSAYHVNEVRILVEEIGAHEQEYAYFRKDHKEVRGRIERRILAFRQTLTKG